MAVLSLVKIALKRNFESYLHPANFIMARAMFVWMEELVTCYPTLWQLAKDELKSIFLPAAFAAFIPRHSPVKHKGDCI